MKTRKQRILEALDRSGVSQTDLANELNITRQSVSIRFKETRDIDSIDFVKAVHKLTKFSMTWLIDGEGDGYAEEPSLVYKIQEIRDQLNSIETSLSKREQEFIIDKALANALENKQAKASKSIPTKKKK